MVEQLVSLLASLAVIIITPTINRIKAKMTAKQRAIMEDIAEVVEQCYKDLSATDKLSAYKDICKTRGINIDKAVEYLETHIIPLSKKINTYTPEPVKKDSTKGVTN